MGRKSSVLRQTNKLALAWSELLPTNYLLYASHSGQVRIIERLSKKPFDSIEYIQYTNMRALFARWRHHEKASKHS